MSEETKWTEGEWHVNECGGIESETGTWVKPLMHDSWEGMRRFASGEEDEANARLMAASKNMAEALMCWPLNELMGMIEDSGDAAMRERAKWFMEVRDHALAKARGETS